MGLLSLGFRFESGRGYHLKGNEMKEKTIKAATYWNKDWKKKQRDVIRKVIDEEMRRIRVSLALPASQDFILAQWSNRLEKAVFDALGL